MPFALHPDATNIPRNSISPTSPAPSTDASQHSTCPAAMALGLGCVPGRLHSAWGLSTAPVQLQSQDPSRESKVGAAGKPQGHLPQRQPPHLNLSGVREGAPRRVCLPSRRCKRLRFHPWVGKTPGAGMETDSSVLGWRIPRTEEPGGPQSVGSHRVGHTECTATLAPGPFSSPPAPPPRQPLAPPPRPWGSGCPGF